MDKFFLRTIVSIILAFGVLVVVYIFPEYLFCAVIAGFVAVALWEFFRLVEGRGFFVYRYFGTIVGALVPVVVFLGNSLPDLKHLEPMLIVVASLMALTLQFIRKDNTRDHLVSVALTLFGLFYIGLGAFRS